MSLAPKSFAAMPASLEHGAETLGLRTGVGMVGDVQEQEGRNAFVTGDVVDGREIPVLHRIAAELLVVAEFRIGLAEGLATRGARLDHQRHVVGVAIDRNAALDDRQRQPLGLQIAVVGADQRRELGTGGMARHDEAIGIAAVLGDVVVNPVNGLRDVADDGFHVDVGRSR